MAAALPQGQKVYRLRGIPDYLDRLDIAKLLSAFLPDDGSPGDIEVASLAPSCDFSSLSPNKTATLTFSKIPLAVRAAALQREWSFSLPGLARPLVLDDTFFGLTTLNDVPPNQHRYDCIVISGLASHPMGSWQPRGPDKSFMWIRDALPKMATHVRFILYGYDTSLIGSKSFQTVSDLALSLINELKAGGWTSPTAKPLIFFAHSLGGVVLKQAFVMLAGSGAREVALLSQTKGAIFFGVPSQGMPMSDLFSMLGTQPNSSALVADISEHSQFLCQLERQVSGISHVRQMSLVWAYETQTTPTVLCVNGQYQRSGPPTILVSKESATGGRCESDPTSTIQIDMNHSDMVKFSPGHHLISLVAYKLDSISHHEPRTTLDSNSDINTKPLLSMTEPDVSSLHSVLQILEQFPDPSLDPEFWDTHAIIESLKPSMRSSRLDQIDERAGHSFEWVFDQPSIGLMPWLHQGSGLFWISGLPGSGKSTMMKFLHNDPRTSQAIEASGWKRGGRQIRASFFFHHRGTAAQKSFQSLVQSILSQILEQEPKLLTALIPMFQEEYQKTLKTRGLKSLRSDLAAMLVKSGGLTIDDSIHSCLEDVLACELWRKNFRELVKRPLLESDVDGPHWDELETASVAAAWPLINGEGDDSDSDSVWEPDTYPEHWGNALKSHFRRLISKWRAAVDIRAKLRKLVESKHAGDAKADAVIQLTSLLNRYQLRQLHRSEIEREIWIVHRLVRAISLIIDQDSLSIDVCLFLDALDEYDGQPDIISKFLRDLTRNHSNSSTKIRVLFSSRPWNVFLDEFGNGPGFRIHEHTENDIRELCARYIQPDMPGSREVIKIIPQIVQRAQGVFLWARLVLDNLCSVTAKFYAEDHPGGRVGHGNLLRGKLLATLQDLPHDLADYYGDIIQRIPATLRPDTYCLLEVVCRSQTPLSLGAVPLLLASSRASDAHQLKEMMTSELADHCSPREAEDQLRAVSGGLVDLVPHVVKSRGHPHSEKETEYHLQLLHQTVLDFVEQPQFKHIALGLRASITEENGHAFLARYFLCRYGLVVDSRALHHAREFERTTGVSMFGFLKGQIFILAGLKRKMDHLAEPLSVSLLGLAITGGLRLLIKDILDEDVNAIAKSVDSLLSLISWSIYKGFSAPKDVVSMIQFILSHGFDPLRDSSGLSRLLVEYRFVPLPRDPIFVPTPEEFTSITTAVLEGCDHVNFTVYVDFYDCHTTLLHFSSLNVAKYLLDRGADPNALDSEGRTPLDFMHGPLRNTEQTGGYLLYPPYELDDACDLIASRGGIIRNEFVKQSIRQLVCGEKHDAKLNLRFLRRWMRNMVLDEDQALARLMNETPAVPLPVSCEPEMDSMKPSSSTTTPDEKHGQRTQVGDDADSAAPESRDDKIWDHHRKTSPHEEGEWEDDSSSDDDADDLGGAPLG